MSRFLQVVLLVSLAFLLSGCALLENAAGVIPKPTMTYRQASLVNSPSSSQLLAYYCPSLLGSGICSPVLGAAPAKQDLRFDFALDFTVENPTDIDIPTMSLLVATSLFQNEPEVQELGLTCVRFCDDGDASCAAQSAEEACGAGDQLNIDSFDDFVSSATDGLLEGADEGLDAAYASNFGIKTIPANGSQDMQVVFTLGLDPMLNILGKVTDDYVDSYVKNGSAEVEIPYSVRRHALG